MIEIMWEIKRVVKKTGQIWINMGDCYASHTLWANKSKYYQDKCLLMQPERFAIRCIDEVGLILRNKIKWAKQVLIKKENKTIGSVMPTSVKDRFNESGEELYFFVKSKKYWSDLDAVRIPHQIFERNGFPNETEYRKYIRSLKDTNLSGTYLSQRWTYRTNPSFNYRVRDAIRKKGQPQFRATEKEIKEYHGKFAGRKDAEMFNSPRARTQRNKVNDPRGNHNGGPGSWRDFKDENLATTNPKGKNIPTIWQINPEPHNFSKELGVDTEHFAVFPQALVEIPIKFGCPENGIVLDPFMGSGTTAVVAKKLGRNYIGIELNSDYIKIAQARLKAIPKPLF